MHAYVNQVDELVPFSPCDTSIQIKVEQIENPS